MRLRLTDEDGSSVAGTTDCLGVQAWDMLGEHWGPIRCADALGIKEVFDAERHSGENTDPLSATKAVLEQLRLNARALET
jgi:hypothetical protein